MFVRYWLAALLAALASVSGSVVWAQYACPAHVSSDCCQQAKCCETKASCAAGDCCQKDDCCKAGKCCQDGGCCCKTGKCDKGCTCCKDNKCECSKGGECCCEKGKCKCKDKSSHAKLSCGCCPFMSRLAKSTAIIMVMPASLPLLGACHTGPVAMLPPPMPAPHVVLPPPPPMLTPPGLPMPTLASPIMPPQTVTLPPPPPLPAGCPCPMAVPMYSAPGSYVTAPGPKASSVVESCLSLLNVAGEVCAVVRPLSLPSLCASVLELLPERCTTPYGYAQLPAPEYLTHPPQYCPPSPPFPMPQEVVSQQGSTYCGAAAAPTCYAAAPAACVPCCTVPTPATAAKVRIIAVPSGDQLEMSIGDDTCIRCKKMTVKLGDNEISVSRFDDRVRIRGDELKATADSVRGNGKDRLILEGDVVLHYKKDGHSANVTGDRIELNLTSGAVMIKPNVSSSVRPAVRIERVEGAGE